MFRNALKELRRRLNKVKKPIKWLILSYFGLVALLVVTYYIAWLTMAYFGKVAMKELLDIIREMVSPVMIGFITFICYLFVDKDNNGIPDYFEKDEKKH